MDARQVAYEIRVEFARKARLDLDDRERYNAELRKRIGTDPEEKRKERERLEYLEAALAMPVEIEDFKVRLDTYDTATVEALITNEQQLTAVRERIRDMLHEAYVLPDGRRVFRTRDGNQVFDEFGKEIGPEIVRADEIDRRKPTWEEFKGWSEQEAKLEEERQQLQEYQQKLDDARTKANDGSLSKDDLDQLDKELDKSMPKAVRDIVQRNEAQRTVIDRDVSSQAAEIAPDSTASIERRTSAMLPVPPSLR